MKIARSLFIGLQAADLLSTVWIIRHGGCELNPLVKLLFPLIGIIGALLTAKVICAAGYFRIRKPVLVYVVTAVYCGIIGWNLVIVKLLARGA